jgi:hypothetical protein
VSGHERAPVELSVRARRLVVSVFGVCLGAELLFLVLDYFVNYSRGAAVASVRGLANIAREDSISSWFGTAQTWMIGLTLALIWWTVRAARPAGAGAWRSRGWLFLAVFFCYMSADDGSRIHERIGTAFKVVALDPGEGDKGAILQLFPSYSWQILFLPIFAAVGLFVIFFLWRELRDRLSWLFVAGAMACLAAAVGLDFIEGLSGDHPWNLYTAIAERYDLEAFTQARFSRDAEEAVGHFAKAIEEFLEMFANTVLWVVFLRQLTRSTSALRFRFTNR